jgi:hypothetical protein
VELFYFFFNNALNFCTAYMFFSTLSIRVTFTLSFSIPTSIVTEKVMSGEVTPYCKYVLNF